MRILILWILWTFISCASLSDTPSLDKVLNPYENLLEVQYRIVYQGSIPVLWVKTSSSNLRVSFSCYKDAFQRQLLFDYERDYRPIFDQSININIEQTPDQFWVFLTLTDLDTGYEFRDAQLVQLHKDSPQTIVLMEDKNRPRWNNVVTTSSLLQFRHANPQIKELHIKYFGQLETAAKHPLDLSENNFNLNQYHFLTTVPIDKKIQLEQLGTYWIQSDSNSNDGLFVLCTAPYFANTAATSSRISCLQYLCTSEVYRAITLFSNPQEQLKNFWSTLKQNSRKKSSNTTELAAIYYDRLHRSNTLFSQIRKGCLTDKGMAFIVFGTPDDVFKWSNKELWYYHATKNRNPLELLFHLKSNEYQLKRSADLSVPYKRSLYNWLNIHTE